MGLLASDISGPPNIGDVLTVIAALFFAGQIIATAHYAASGDPLVLTFVQFCVTAVLSFGTALAFNGFPAPRGSEGLGAIAFATFFCTFLCFLVQNISQKFTHPAHVSILLGLESVFGLLSGIVILREAFTLRMGVGCFLIFGAILFAELFPVLSPPLPPAQVSPSRSR
jgi:drug/metabolite transporter (DMT)-like permease